MERSRSPSLRQGPLLGKFRSEKSNTSSQGKIERLFAWLQAFRRLVARTSEYAENFSGIYRGLRRSWQLHFLTLTPCEALLGQLGLSKRTERIRR